MPKYSQLELDKVNMNDGLTISLSQFFDSVPAALKHNITGGPRYIYIYIYKGPTVLSKGVKSSPLINISLLLPKKFILNI